MQYVDQINGVYVWSCNRYSYVQLKLVGGKGKCNGKGIHVSR